MSYSPITSLSADVKYINWNKNWNEIVVEFNGSGAEYFLNKTLTLSAGYHFNDEAVDDNYFNPIISADVEHTLCMGLSANAPGSELSGAETDYNAFSTQVSISFFY